MDRGKIRIMEENLVAKIAAGEVFERPSSVVKELMENSLDSAPTEVTVTVAEGGRRLIKVIDNGCGIPGEDAPLAFARHATSKISKESDLSKIQTMGFRGEALWCISSVARVELKTRTNEQTSGTVVRVEGGKVLSVGEEGLVEGTTIEVKDLFFNTPARLKFLKSVEYEFGRILDVFKRIALANPQIRFKLIHGSSKVSEAFRGSLLQRIGDLFGKDILDGMIPVETPDVKGFTGTPDLTFPTSRNLYVFVNSRPVWDRSINSAILSGYSTLIEKSRYPFTVIDIKIPPDCVDVNVHPAKSEVRFKNQRFVFDFVRSSISGALSRAYSPRVPVPAAYEETEKEKGISFAGEAAGDPWRDKDTRPPKHPSLSISFNEVRNPDLLDMETVGQLWGEFLVAQSPSNGGEFLLIDQHGASERCAFERLKRDYYDGGGVRSQMLLLPEKLDTTPDETHSIYEMLPHLGRLGFEVIPFGKSEKAGGETFLVKSAPIVSPGNLRLLIMDLAEEFSQSGGSARIEGWIEGALMRIACHSVVRGPRPLTKEEGNALLRDMARIDFAARCPHGRPVIRKFSRKEIEAMFKR